MGNKDYTKFSNNFEKVENKRIVINNKPVVDNKVEETVEKINNEVIVNQNNIIVEGVTEIPKDADVVNNVILPGNAKLKGVVVPGKLNVRKQPSKDSEVLEIITKNSEVEIEFIEESENFYKVCTKSGVNGYCMKEFINIK